MKCLNSITGKCDEKVPAGFWDDIAAKLTLRFGSGEFTDGIIEATDGHGIEYGRERLATKVCEGRDLTARELIKFIHTDMLDWTEGRGANDDVTFVIVKAR